MNSPTVVRGSVTCRESGLEISALGYILICIRSRNACAACHTAFLWPGFVHPFVVVFRNVGIFLMCHKESYLWSDIRNSNFKPFVFLIVALYLNGERVCLTATIAFSLAI